MGTKHDATDRGRPPRESQRDVALDLLAAAKETLNMKGHSEITMRELAGLAGTNQAMISYYYDSKDGLFSAIVEDALRTKRKKLDEFEAGLAKIEGCRMRAFLALLMEHYLKSVSLYRIISAELTNNRSLIRRRYAGRGRKMYNQVERILSKMKALGTLRPDANIKHAIITLTCFVHGPIALSPIIEEFQTSMDELCSPEWIDHLTALMLLRFGPPGAPPSA